MEIFIRLVNMPHAIGAYVTHNADDSYTIVLNARWAFEMQRLAYQHEMNHIIRSDLFNLNPIDQVEGVPDRFIFLPYYSYEAYCVAT